MKETKKINGVVKWFNDMKGFGFISGEDNQDYFCHRNSIIFNELLKEGDKVLFEPEHTEKGLQGKNVEKLI